MTGPYLGAGDGTLLTFGEPETSSLKTSFQEKVSLQSATGTSRRGLLARVNVRDQTIQKTPTRDVLCMVRVTGL